MNILKSQCPKTDPYGTPDLTTHEKERVPVNTNRRLSIDQITMKPIDIIKGESEASFLTK
jgi:hypothetical protein